MSSLLAGAIGGLAAGLKMAGGEILSYRRGNDSLDGVTGIPARSHHTSDQAGDTGFDVSSRERDFIFVAAELVIGGETIEPQRGDEIVWVAADRTRTFQVLPRGDDRPFRHCDPTLTLLRVYTVEKVTSE